VSFSGGLRVDGEVKGNVVAAGGQPSTLVVSEQASIDGEIHVSHLVVNGAINGPVFSAEFLELQARSRVKGDVHYNTLEMHLGAVVEGRLVHSSSIAEGGKTVELKIASRN
jgi:cytoskeletal protein CcmA (bactofilin family)